MNQLILERFAQVRPLPTRSTRTIKFRRYLSLPLATTPISEGVTPPADTMSYEDVQATVEQYGSWLELTDVVQDTHEDPILMEMSDLLGEQAPDTLETVRFNTFKAGTQAVYNRDAGTTGRVDVNQNFADTATSLGAMVDYIHREMKRQKARQISAILKATPNVETMPLPGAYWGFGHTDLEADLRKSTNFVPVEQYPNSTPTVPGEVGAQGQVRFALSQLYTPWIGAGDDDAEGDGATSLTNGTDINVYPIVIIAQNCIGLVPLKGKTAITPKVLNPGVPRGGDPLGQKGSIGWKTYHAAVILQDLWVWRIETAVQDVAGGFAN